MVLLAFSLQDQIEKYGAYVGIASFFGLALLSLRYFAQAREVKRLREWAGRAPERAAEVEAMAIAHAERGPRGRGGGGARAGRRRRGPPRRLRRARRARPPRTAPSPSSRPRSPRSPS